MIILYIKKKKNNRYISTYRAFCFKSRIHCRWRILRNTPRRRLGLQTKRTDYKPADHGWSCRPTASTSRAVEWRSAASPINLCCTKSTQLLSWWMTRPDSPRWLVLLQCWDRVSSILSTPIHFAWPTTTGQIYESLL